MPSELLKLNSQDIDSLSRERTVFFFPVGPVEDHGPHLPVGLDVLHAEKLARRLAEKVEQEFSGWKGVLLPAAPLGIDSNTTQFQLTVRAHVLRDWLVDATTALRKQGFQNFACVSGSLGPKQLTAIEEAGKILARRSLFGLVSKTAFVSASSALVDAKTVRSSPFWPDLAEHGGDHDTSLALYISPELVSPIFKNLPQIEREPLWTTRAAHRFLKKTKGYWGDPSSADVEKGKALLSRSENQIWDRLKPRLNGVFAPNAFRSWYSVIPSNRSFFKSWILAILILLIIGTWTMISLRGI
jgi:creatinine amidohydrolase